MKRLATVGAAVLGAWLLLAGPSLATAPPAGPPYPDAVAGQRVYDSAGLFSPSTVTQAQALIVGIEARTGAQIAVYTQVKPASYTLDLANADALALMNQWGVGRKGFDDGLVILFDMDNNLRHGQVSLYAGSGYRAAFLSDPERQAIFDDDMKPLLSEGDLDGGLMIALHDIDANATPEHAATLERGRQINALIFVGAAGLGLVLILYVLLSWLRHGRDPIAIDDNSILMLAPPADLTPAMATILLDDKSSDRTVSAGLVDLAARGCIAFVADTKPTGGTETGIKYLGEGEAGLPAPEASLRDDIAKKGLNHDNYLTPHTLYRLIGGFDDLKSDLEAAAVKRGWLTGKPGEVMFHWFGIGSLEITASIVIGFFWILTQVSSLLVASISLALAGIVTLVVARYMPSRTPQGAMLWSMLWAYRRTLQLTLAQAHTMTDAVKARALPWVTTPDQIMAWGVALGLNDEIQAVLGRSMGIDEEEPAESIATRWYPQWWLSESSYGHSGHATRGHAASSASGLFSASAIPDPGSIMAALGSISHPWEPSSSGSGRSGSSSFSGGSFGGGGGGGGGGAGGGF